MAQSETKLEKLKYRLLKLIDVSGFRVFDPVIRLLFGEEPRKQVAEILKFLVTPAIFVLGCLALWTFMAPRHKTNSGEVPKPSQVWDAAVINQTLKDREDEKERDFVESGEHRDARIAAITAQLEAKRAESADLKKQLEEIRVSAQREYDETVASRRTDAQERLAAIKAEQKTRGAAAVAMSNKVAAGSATKEQLLDLLREDKLLQEGEEDLQKDIKNELKLLDDKPVAIRRAELASNSVANEVQHLSKRLDYLTKGNRTTRFEKADASRVAAMSKLEKQTSAKGILSAAKSVVHFEKSAEKTAEQEYPRRATIWLQVQRSLFTVFVGFLLAAAIAIPLGIMCGLNKVVMACLTPIISIFKPVSPVVWLLIFQIVIGAFFLPDPESYWLFELCAELPIIGDLGVNPALIFSACTVAMCAVWPALVNTALGVSSIEQDHLNVAKVLRLGLWSRLFKIIIPSALPLVFAGLRISLGVGWMVLIAAEALSSSEGLGKFVWDEYQNGSSYSFANIIFACFLVGAIGFVLDRIMIVLQRSVSFDDGAAVV